MSNVNHEEWIKLRKVVADLEAENKRLKDVAAILVEALEKVENHTEVIAGKSAMKHSAYYLIATKALSEYRKVVGE